MPHEKERIVFNGRPLYFVEESIIRYLSSLGAQVFIIPPLFTPHDNFKKYLESFDCLVLHGGSDVNPKIYGELAIKAEWKGEPERDEYDIKLLEAAYELELPVLGICRGAQIINVYFGGSLYQDINYQLPKKLIHRNADIYEKNYHKISICEDSLLAEIYDYKKGNLLVNSVHHQAIKKIGEDLHIEAYSEDNIIEAVRLNDSKKNRFIWGIQWHPEFQTQDEDHLLDPKPILKRFLDEVRKRK